MTRKKGKALPKTYTDLPMCMVPKDVAAVLGVSMPTAYEIVNRKDFPSIRIGENKNRQKIIIPRDRFLKWLYQEDYEAITGEIDETKKKSPTCDQHIRDKLLIRAHSQQ